MFFISYAPPHKPVSSRTLVRWVSDILHKACIHTKTFKTHSLLSASTSNTLSVGLSLTEIAKAAGWTNVKTFGKFYNKPVIDNNFRNFLLTNNFIYIFRYCMLRIGACMIYFILYTYTNLGFKISFQYLSSGPELINGEITPKIKLAK